MFIRRLFLGGCISCCWPNGRANWIETEGILRGQVVLTKVGWSQTYEQSGNEVPFVTQTWKLHGTSAIVPRCHGHSWTLAKVSNRCEGRWRSPCNTNPINIQHPTHSLSQYAAVWQQSEVGKCDPTDAVGRKASLSTPIVQSRCMAGKILSVALGNHNNGNCVWYAGVNNPTTMSINTLFSWCMLHAKYYFYYFDTSSVYESSTYWWRTQHVIAENTQKVRSR